MGSMKQKIFFLLLAGTTAIGGYAVGQGASPQVQAFVDAVVPIGPIEPEWYGAAADAVTRAPADADVIRQAIRLGLVNGKKGDNTLLLAVSVAQNQKLIKQNARIIELLEKQATTPKS